MHAENNSVKTSVINMDIVDAMKSYNAIESSWWNTSRAAWPISYKSDAYIFASWSAIK